ncbi:SSI family serine proteinase inhibitor [Streptomyces sp. NPDC004266]|uniref:SSI family serine proteinase inhibitor n=1 Tax=Streptomyces sp. NPDC004266 TaxID=3364693 RepID=UPI003674B6C7
MKKIITVVLGAGLLAPVLVPVASAAAPVGPTHDARIELTVARTQGDVEAVGFVWLNCPGRSGQDHPRTREACADLRTAHGDFARLPGQATAICSNDGGRVTVTAHGIYQGRQVHWEHAFDNDCELALATGPVFDF